MERAEALRLISDGHAVYSVDEAKEIFEAIEVSWDDNYAFKGHSDRGPGNPKGLLMAPGAEGELVVTALTIGSVACRHYGLQHESFSGRGKQGQEYAYRLRTYFWAKATNFQIKGH